jgi:hypothetical protein
MHNYCRNASMMTAQELLDLARELNPDKLLDDPSAALKDAYTFSQALELARNELAEPILPDALAHPSLPSSLVARFQQFMQHTGMTYREVGTEIGVHATTVGTWAKGTRDIKGRNVSKVEKFLKRQGQ